MDFDPDFRLDFGGFFSPSSRLKLGSSEILVVFLFFLRNDVIVFVCGNKRELKVPAAIAWYSECVAAGASP